jgi:hypothetical protein
MKFTKDIIAMWKHSYRTDKLVFWIGATGTVASIIASVILNITIHNPWMWTVLIFYTYGSIALGYTSYLLRDSWMVVLMTWYTFINTVGMVSLAIGK